MRPGLRLLFTLMALCVLNACDDDEKPKTTPQVATGAVTEILTTSALGSGEITSNGNATITASGLCYSSASAVPTIDDNKTEVTATNGTFTSLMEGLSSGTTYHVRAYATNSVGTGYGDVVDFTTGNAPPVATAVAITGTAQVGETLTAAYSYNDAENDLESGTTIKWYKANDAAGSGEMVINGASTSTYKIVGADEFKFIRVGITPKAATGNATGSEVKSTFTNSIAPEPTTVTFTYNGASVTYGIIISSITGRKWLDRNLGAPGTPTAYDNYQNYGDLFQWGRGTDGHQLITRTGATNATTAAVNGTTTTVSTSNTPGNSLFIVNDLVSPYDWRNPQNNNLWQGSGGINNPCPSGWHVPTEAEWDAENLHLMEGAYTQLKLTLGGKRKIDGTGFSGTAAYGYYWSSTARSSEGSAVAYLFATADQGPAKTGDWRTTGLSCRCIKDQ